MNKHIEKLKKQLVEISDVINSFQSEAVQVRVVDRLLDVMLESEKSDTDVAEAFNKKGRKLKSDNEDYTASGKKKPGATKVLNQLLTTDYFNTPHSIASIANYCHDNFGSNFKTSELSGILLKLANENRLKRERSKDNNRFEYVIA